MCSSFSAGYMFPPHDLLALASTAKALGHETCFTDAVAEGMNEQQVYDEIKRIQPDMIVSLMSFELYDLDVQVVKRLKEKFPQVTYGVFGHYPSHFRQETMEHTGADFIMLGEPDHVFERLLKEWSGGPLPTDHIGTVVRMSDGKMAVNEEDRRVPNPNALPMPAYEMLKSEYYKEPFLESPLGVIQTARGCPYKCNYCVHSFGTKLTVLTPENVVDQILYMKKHNGIKALRFIDDTFTAIPSRVIKICKLMIEHGVNLPWTCLSRADTLDIEMLQWMKKAGCMRLNVGMESGSQRILDLLDKGLNVEDSLRNLQAARKTGLELMGFFLTGIPGETEDDINQSIAFAKKTFHYAVADNLIVYPGTPLFEKFGNLVDFTLVPYHNEFADPVFRAKADKHRSRFYREFYFSINFMLYSPKKILFQPSHLKVMVPFVAKIAFDRKGNVKRGLMSADPNR